jgi:hypothetical protein
MIARFTLRRIALAIGALAAINWSVAEVAADVRCCPPAEPVIVYVVQEAPPAEPQQPSWIFDRSTYTNDPATGARVAQYMRKPPIEPLPDQRAVTSRYRRTQTNLRGTQGSYETDYQVQAWGNGRGGLDAEWERFHDAWKESYLSGGYYNGPGYGGYPTYGGYPGWGYGNGYPGYGAPPYGYPQQPHQPYPHGPGGRGPVYPRGEYHPE